MIIMIIHDNKKNKQTMSLVVNDNIIVFKAQMTMFEV